MAKDSKQNPIFASPHKQITTSNFTTLHTQHTLPHSQAHPHTHSHTHTLSLNLRRRRVLQLGIPAKSHDPDLAEGIDPPPNPNRHETHRTAAGSGSRPRRHTPRLSDSLRLVLLPSILPEAEPLASAAEPSVADDVVREPRRAAALVVAPQSAIARLLGTRAAVRTGESRRQAGGIAVLHWFGSGAGGRVRRNEESGWRYAARIVRK